MKVRIEQTVTVDDWYRRAIRRFYGKEGLASRDEIRRWLFTYGTSMDDDLAMQESSVDELVRERGEDPGSPRKLDAKEE